MQSFFTGECLCKQVGFEINSEPTVVSCCHCKNCKKYTGTVFTTNVVFPAGTLCVTKGKELIQTYHDSAQDSGNPISRHFCSYCGSPLYNDGGDFSHSLAVFTSALENYEPQTPQVEYYAKDRVLWLPEFDGSEKARTKPGRELS